MRETESAADEALNKHTNTNTTTEQSAATGNAICHGIVMDNTVLLVTSMMKERERRMRKPSMTYDYFIPRRGRRRAQRSM